MIPIIDPHLIHFKWNVELTFSRKTKRENTIKVSSWLIFCFKTSNIILIEKIYLIRYKFSTHNYGKREMVKSCLNKKSITNIENKNTTTKQIKLQLTINMKRLIIQLQQSQSICCVIQKYTKHISTRALTLNNFCKQIPRKHLQFILHYMMPRVIHMQPDIVFRY